MLDRTGRVHKSFMRISKVYNNLVRANVQGIREKFYQAHLVEREYKWGVDRVFTQFGGRKGKLKLYSLDDRPAVWCVDSKLGKIWKQEWYYLGERHREGGPAVIIQHDNSRREEWWVQGRRHRDGEPAVVDQSRIFGKDYLTEEWWIRGRRHRKDGPALTRSGPFRTLTEWWTDGERTRTESTMKF